jgi:hypothetical protein
MTTDVLEIFVIALSFLVCLMIAVAIKISVDRYFYSSNSQSSPTAQAVLLTADSTDPPVPPLRPSQPLIAEGVPDPDSADECHDIIQPMDISQERIAELESKIEQALTYGKLMRTELDIVNEKTQLALSLATEAALKEIRDQDEVILQLRAELEAKKSKNEAEKPAETGIPSAMGPVPEMPAICAAPEGNTRDDPPSLDHEMNPHKKKITITVMNGQDLMVNDRVTGHLKAYVSVYVKENDKIKKRNTKKVSSFGVNPHWNEELNFEVINPETTSVVFKVKTSEIMTLKNADVLAWTEINMKQLFETNLVQRIPLQEASNPNACLIVKIGIQDVSTEPESFGLKKWFNCCLGGPK